MKDRSEELTCQAKRLLCWYPKDWRARYGDEFAELLVAEMCRATALAETQRRRRLERAYCKAYRRGARRSGDRAQRPGSSQLGIPRLCVGCLPRVRRRHVVAVDHRLAVVGTSYESTYAAMILMSGAMLLFSSWRCWRRFRSPVASSPTCAAGIPVACAPVVAPPRRRRLLDDRQPALRERLAGYRRTPLGAAGSRARRRGRIHLGVDPLRHLLLGPPRSACRLPHARARLDGGQSRRHRLCDGGSRQDRPRADLPSESCATRLALARVAAFGMGAFLVGACSWVIDGVPGQTPVSRWGHRRCRACDDGRGPGCRRPRCTTSPPWRPCPQAALRPIAIRDQRRTRPSTGLHRLSAGESPGIRTKTQPAHACSSAGLAVAAVAAAGATAIELVSHGILPGRSCSTSSTVPVRCPARR